MITIEKLKVGFILKDGLEDAGHACETVESLLRTLRTVLEPEPKKKEPKIKVDTPPGLELKKIEKIEPAKESIIIPRFQIDKNLLVYHKPISIAELEDGRIYLRYKGSVTCTAKSKLSSLPDPLPKGYLKEKYGLAYNKITAIHFYLKHLKETTVIKEKEETPAKEVNQYPITRFVEPGVFDFTYCAKNNLEGGLFYHNKDRHFAIKTTMQAYKNEVVYATQDQIQSLKNYTPEELREALSGISEDKQIILKKFLEYQNKYGNIRI